MSQYMAITSACKIFTLAPPRPSLSISSRILGSNNMALNLPPLPMLSKNIANHPNYVAAPLESRQCGVKVHASLNNMHGDIGDDNENIDTILSVTAVTCLTVAGLLFAGFRKNGYLLNGPAMLMFVTGAVIGAWIQNRLLNKVKQLKKMFSEGNLVERIEKLEEESREQNQKLKIWIMSGSTNIF